MPELTKARIINDSVEFTITAAKADAGRVRRALKAALAALSSAEAFQDDHMYSVEDVFGPACPGRTLRGYRLREGLTQKELATRTGLRASHISDMENGRRPIGKETAKRLAKALGAPYRMLL